MKLPAVRVHAGLRARRDEGKEGERERHGTRQHHEGGPAGKRWRRISRRRGHDSDACQKADDTPEWAAGNHDAERPTELLDTRPAYGAAERESAQTEETESEAPPLCVALQHQRANDQTVKTKPN